MKKRMAALALAATVGLIGCGGSGTAATTAAPAVAPAAGGTTAAPAVGDTAVSPAASGAADASMVDTIRVWSDNAHEQALRKEQIQNFNDTTLQFEFAKLAPKLGIIAGIVADGSVLPGAAGMDADAMRAQFSEGRVGMMPAVSFDVDVYND